MFVKLIFVESLILDIVIYFKFQCVSIKANRRIYLIFCFFNSLCAFFFFFLGGVIQCFLRCCVNQI